MRSKDMETQKFAKLLEAINLNVLKLNDRVESIIDGREKNSLRQVQTGRLRQLLQASNHKIPSPNNPKISAKML